MENTDTQQDLIPEQELQRLLSQNFPSHLNLKICRAAVKGNKEFRETTKDDLIILNYDYCYKGSFPNPNQEKDDLRKYLMKVRRSTGNNCQEIIDILTESAGE
jgi:hypothetical protein